MKKRGFSILFLVLSSLILLYIAMHCNTLPLVEYVEAVHRGEIPHEEIADTMYAYYDITLERPQTVEVDLRTTQIFSIHDFNHGYLWIMIDCQGRDDSGGVTYGSIGIERWEIEKIDGKWEIIKIHDYWTPHWISRLFGSR